MQIRNSHVPQPAVLRQRNRRRRRYIRRLLWLALPVSIVSLQQWKTQPTFTLLIQIIRMRLSETMNSEVNRTSEEEQYLITQPVYSTSVSAQKPRKDFSRHRITEITMGRPIHYRQTTTSMHGPIRCSCKQMCFSEKAGRLPPD